jgi:hypothetical protein
VEKIFICYRRDDTSSITGRIFDRIAANFGQANVFKDVYSIPLGVDFARYIQEFIRQCGVQLVVIGPRWRDGTNAHRLADPNDYVRIEIESAYRHGIPIIPLLVQGSHMPHRNELPPSLQFLAQLNGQPIRDDPDFDLDIGRVIIAISSLVKNKGTPLPDSRGSDIASRPMIIQTLPPIRQRNWIARHPILSIIATFLIISSLVLGTLGLILHNSKPLTANQIIDKAKQIPYSELNGNLIFMGTFKSNNTSVPIRSSLGTFGATAHPNRASAKLTISVSNTNLTVELISDQDRNIYYDETTINNTPSGWQQISSPNEDLVTFPIITSIFDEYENANLVSSDENINGIETYHLKEGTNEIWIRKDNFNIEQFNASLSVSMAQTSLQGSLIVTSVDLNTSYSIDIPISVKSYVSSIPYCNQTENKTLDIWRNNNSPNQIVTCAPNGVLITQEANAPNLAALFFKWNFSSNFMSSIDVSQLQPPNSCAGIGDDIYNDTLEITIFICNNNGGYITKYDYRTRTGTSYPITNTATTQLNYPITLKLVVQSKSVIFYLNNTQVTFNVNGSNSSSFDVISVPNNTSNVFLAVGPSYSTTENSALFSNYNYVPG